MQIHVITCDDDGRRKVFAFEDKLKAKLKFVDLFTSYSIESGNVEETDYYDETMDECFDGGYAKFKVNGYFVDLYYDTCKLEK